MTPPPYTVRFSSEPALEGLFQDLLAAGQTRRDLDQGFASIDYSRVRGGASQGASDRSLDSAELFQRITAVSGLTSAYRRFAGEALPWEPGSGAATQAALQAFDRDLSAWRAANALPSGTNLDLARHIFAWVTDARGLNLSVRQNLPERNFDETIANLGGDCTEFTKVLMTLLRRAGFEAFPVWVGEDSRGDRVQHVAAGIRVGGRTLLLDPIYGAFDARHRQTVRLSDREFLAWHWNHRALDQWNVSAAAAQGLFQRALWMDPANPHILFNRGLWQRDARHDNAAARTDFEAALRADPRFSEAHYELGNMEYDAGRYREAATRYSQALALHAGDSRYRRNLILAQCRLGNLPEARRQLDLLVEQDPHAEGLAQLRRLVGS
ncbi:tetratricopeptide repeat protein [Deltaproteobacteria bacterium PRO3]|nr:tetratricopeptide repeat protein [Deltaproteobacteria bacterium PRO3]